MGIAPIEFPPPVQSEKEFIGGFEDAEDERIVHPPRRRIIGRRSH